MCVYTMWRSEDNLWDSFLSFYRMGLRDTTWVSRHGSKCFYLLNYCFGPQNVGLMYSVVRKHDSKLIT